MPEHPYTPSPEQPGTRSGNPNDGCQFLWLGILLDHSSGRPHDQGKNPEALHHGKVFSCTSLFMVWTGLRESLGHSADVVSSLGPPRDQPKGPV